MGLRFFPHRPRAKNPNWGYHKGAPFITIVNIVAFHKFKNLPHFQILTFQSSLRGWWSQSQPSTVHSWHSPPHTHPDPHHPVLLPSSRGVQLYLEKCHHGHQNSPPTARQHPPHRHLTWLSSDSLLCSAKRLFSAHKLPWCLDLPSNM